jgi:hypothetical protein
MTAQNTCCAPAHVRIGWPARSNVTSTLVENNGTPIREYREKS